VQDAIEARRSALKAAASNQQAIASKDSANATYAAIPALLSSVQALIVPDMPADLRAEQTSTKTGKLVSAAREAAEAAKRSAEAAVANYYNATQRPSTMPP
jgi:hypothetical protein